MKIHQYFSLEVNLISDTDIEQTIEESIDLPYPKEASIFTIFSPEDWLRAGREVRQAFRQEKPQTLSYLASGFFIDLLDYCGEDYSEIDFDAEEAESLERFITGPVLSEYLKTLPATHPFPGTFQQVKNSEPFIYAHIPYEELIQLSLLDLPNTSEEEELQAILNTDDDSYWHKRWMDQLVESIRNAVEDAKSNSTRPGLFIYPSIYPKKVDELWEEEAPLVEINKAMDFLLDAERGQIENFQQDLHPFLLKMIQKYLEDKINALQKAVIQIDKHNPEAQELEQWFESTYKLEAFRGQPRKLLYFLLNKLNP